METLQPISSAHGERTLVAPLWHTIVLVVVILGIALLQGRQQQQLRSIQLRSRLPLYGAMILFELVLFAYVWLLGLRITRTPLRELIGGRWGSLKDLAIDIGVAFLFWIVVAGVLLGLGKLLGVNTGGMRAVKALLPQGWVEMAAWVVLCVTAGFCEEFLFRGYLQRQLLALTGRIEWAIAFQALVFGAAHVYQGMKGVLTIAVYGAMFGVLAALRRNLRPGMIQHAGQDIFSGIVGSALARKNYF
jgi:membrane protease YdiL (CAAX protease family)